MGLAAKLGHVSSSAPSGLSRDFWLYLGGQSVSQLGSSFTAFALPLLVYTLTGSAVDLAFTTGAVFVPYLLFGLLLGAVADRVDRRRALITVDVARAGVIAVLPLLSLLGQLRVGEVYAVAFVQSTLGILFEAAEFAAVPQLVGPGALVTANGRLLADSTTFALSALSILAVRRPLGSGRTVAPDGGSATEPDGGSRTEQDGGSATEQDGGSTPEPAGGRAGVRTLLQDVREGLAYVWRHPVLRAISLMMALVNFVFATAYAQLVLYGKSVLHATNPQIGWLFAAGSAGVVLVGLSAGWLRRRLPFPALTLGALIASGLLLVTFALSRSYPVALAAWGLSEGIGLLLNINTGSLRQAIVPSQLLGRVMSVAAVMAWSAIPLGALTGAAVITATGNLRAVYAGIGLLTAAIALGFWATPIRHGDRYFTSPPAQPASAESQPGGAA